MHQTFTWPVGRAAEVDARAEPAAPSLPVVVYFMAATAGGACTGLLLATLGTASASVAGVTSGVLLALALPVVVIAASGQWRGRVAPLPERRRQVPTRWLQWPRRTATAAAFGIMIGSGWAVYLHHAVAWALALLVALALEPVGGAAVGAAYGATRGLALTITWHCDRTGRERPDWASIGARRGRLALTLAIASATIYTALLTAAFV